MDRRGFLQGILAAAAAPAIVRVGSLMPIVIPTFSEVIALNNIQQYNGLLTIEMIKREALLVLHQNVTFVR